MNEGRNQTWRDSFHRRITLAALASGRSSLRSGLILRRSHRAIDLGGMPEDGLIFGPRAARFFDR